MTARQRAYHHSVNRLRATVECAISHLKAWKVLMTSYHRIMTNVLNMLRTLTARRSS